MQAMYASGCGESLFPPDTLVTSKDLITWARAGMTYNNRHKKQIMAEDREPGHFNGTVEGTLSGFPNIFITFKLNC